MYISTYPTPNILSLKGCTFRNVDYLNQRVTLAHIISITVQLWSREKQRNQYFWYEKKMLQQNTGSICVYENV
jgi:hypothetical protein